MLGDCFEADILPLLHVSTHVADNERNSESGAAVEFAGESFSGLSGFFGFGGAKINQVTIVTDDGLGVDSALFDGSFKFSGRCGVNRLAVPLLGGGCEDLNGCATDGFSTTDGIGESFSGGHVGADKSCRHS